MKNNKIFMPKRQIFRDGPEQGHDFEIKPNIDHLKSNEINDSTLQSKKLNYKIINEVKKSLVKLKQEPLSKELTSEELAIQEKLNKCEVEMQTIEFYLNVIRETQKSTKEKQGFDIDKKLIESLKEKIITICDEMEREAKEVLDHLATREVDKERAKKYIDYSYNTRDSFK